MRRRVFRALYSFLTLGAFWLSVPALSGAAIAQDPSLVGWWRLDEASGTAATDSSGNGNNGTLIGNVTWAPGMVGTALSFSGNSLVKGTNSGTNFPVGNAARSMAAWVMLPAKVSGSYGILSTGTNDSSKTNAMNLSINSDGTVGFTTGNTTSNWAKTRIDDGNWHHVTGVYEGSSTNVSRIYVDGRLEGFSALANVPNTGTGPGKSASHLARPPVSPALSTRCACTLVRWLSRTSKRLSPAMAV